MKLSDSEASPSTVFLFYCTSIFTILQPLATGSGYHEIKVMKYPTKTEHEAMGQGQPTEDHWKVIFGGVVLFFAVIHSTCKHALRKESTIKGPLDDLELTVDSVNIVLASLASYLSNKSSSEEISKLPQTTWVEPLYNQRPRDWQNLFALTTFCYKMEPRYNEPLYNEVLDIKNDFPYPSNSKIYGKKPRYNETTL